MTRPSLRERLQGINQRSLFGPGRDRTGANVTGQPEADELPPPGQSRAEAIQRLQVGLFGIGAMVLLVGLASIIGSQADLTEDSAAPEAAPTTEPMPEPSRANPLADAGVVPDIAAEPSPSPTTVLDTPSPPADAAPPQ